MKTFDLNGSWLFRAVNAYGALPKALRSSVTKWLPAAVPGTVHTDLMANNIIPDPFYRMNELDVQWVDGQQWRYRKEFVLPPDFMEERHIDLVAAGLDTYAEITLNGKRVGETANMFVGHRFPVKKYLRPGKNTLEILFDSPVVRSKKLEERHGRLLVSHDPHRVYVRKAQYSFSWDWGPKLTTSGVWRPIALEAYSDARLSDPVVRVIALEKKKAVVEVSVDISPGGKHLTLHAYIGGPSSSVERIIPVEGTAASFRVEIPDPHPWWPNGYGDQPMYSVVLTLLKESESIGQMEIPFALRTVRLAREKDAEGESFIIEINGVPIYCKGVDWIPCDAFLPRIPDATYETLLHRAKDAHMNMVRVWGGGIYEQDIFYALCDRLGLMVWQDFMFACGEYPDERWFHVSVRDEAEKAVKRLRNHPSIVLWCGNNECEWMYCTEHPGSSPDDMRGAAIFRDLLPSVCRSLDGTRPYWRSSPFGSGFPNAESNGNHHQWMVWSFWKDFTEYTNDNARFVTEFGFQSPANRSTFEAVMIPEDRDPQSLVMEHHNKQIEGTERLFRFQAAHYRVADSFDEFIYKGQLVQAEALKTAVEHWRRRKFNTAGSLFWQLNDCWPVSSWAVIDSALRPKAAYYYAKKFFAPVLLSFRNTPGGVEVWVVNDLRKRITGNLLLQLLSFGGTNIRQEARAVSVGPNASKKVYRIDSGLYASLDPAEHYLLGELYSGNTLLSDNRLFFREPKHLHLGDAAIETQFYKNGEGAFTLQLRSPALVKNLAIEFSGADAELSDNYFDLDPGRPREITVGADGDVGDLERRLTLRWL